MRNKLVMPKKVSENIVHLSRWQKQFAGDSFDFDYHLMWDHVLDPGYYKCAAILHKDMANLDKIGLNGMVSCQVQRVFFPTGLPMYAMAKALWDKTSEFEAVAGEYFLAAFGAEAEAVSLYLRTLSEMFYQRAGGHKEAAVKYAEQLKEYMNQIEMETLNVLDVQDYRHVLSKFLPL